MNETQNSKNVLSLRNKYFSDPRKRITLQPGERLLEQGTYNDKLFLILEGSVTGFLADENGENFEVFRSSEHMFLGVYSFFSSQHITYLTIIASEVTTVAYLEKNDRIDFAEKFDSDFLPVIVNELYLRQTLAQRLTWQRQAAFRKLNENEKMAVLGQLAAGLAHELNNSVGVLQRNTEWLVEALQRYLKNKNISSVFESALQEGILLNTQSLRARQNALGNQFSLTRKMIKQLAKTRLTDEEIAKLVKNNANELHETILYSEVGFVLHDMRVAATHAAHVVESVRELGLNDRASVEETSLFKTVSNALTLLKQQTKNVKVEVEAEADGTVRSNPGDLVQVWVNLIKNACESLEQSGKNENAKLSIRISELETEYLVVIADNGPGISPEKLAHIFEPSYTTKVKGLSFGLGLGLSIVKKIVTRYKGSINVKSDNKETRFEVRLPKTANQP